MPKRSKLDSFLVGLWHFTLLIGVVSVILELPAALSDWLGINLDTFTVKLGLLIGYVWLYFKVESIKHADRDREEFERRLRIKDQEKKDKELEEYIRRYHLCNDDPAGLNEQEAE